MMSPSTPQRSAPDIPAIPRHSRPHTVIPAKAGIPPLERANLAQFNHPTTKEIAK